MNYALHDLAGNIGVILIVGAYALLTLNKIQSKGFWYSFFNGLGALLILVSLMFEFNASAFILQAGWIVASLIGIATFYKNKRRTNE